MRKALKNEIGEKRSNYRKVIRPFKKVKWPLLKLNAFLC